MKNKIKLIGTFGLSIACAAIVIGTAQRLSPNSAWFKLYYVDFFNNYLREDFELSDGTKGKGNNIIYLTIQVGEGDKVEKPADPVRARYEFQGWYLEEACENVYDFNQEITGNLRLFAKWGIAQEDEGQEPPYTPPSTVVPDEAGIDYMIDSIMNFKINGVVVKLPTAAIARLEANKDNVLPLMEYRVKSGITMTATYASNAITVKIGEQTNTITVRDDSANYIVTSNSNYETKAKKYEDKIEEENENYHVMLAGSSSIEFWESSKQDLMPVVSYNHGIGGTTIEEWDEKLNQRLVFPYKPKMVVYYVGINNVINSKQDAATIWNNLEKFFNDTHEALPNTKVQYIMMNLIPGYKDYFTTINTVNAKVVEYQQSNPWLTLINPGTALLKENGEPNAAYFRTDGLHLSYYGYVVWGGIIKKSIFEGLEQ